MVLYKCWIVEYHIWLVYYLILFNNNIWGLIVNYISSVRYLLFLEKYTKAIQHKLINLNSDAIQQTYLSYAG